MSMALRIYFIEQDRLAAAFAPRRGGLWSIISSRTLLEWVEKELRRARRAGDADAHHIMGEVEDVLLGDLEWEDGAPGAEHVVEIDMLAAIEDLGKIGARLPEHVADRFWGSDYRGWTRFPSNLPTNSPIRALDLPGWQFFHRKDIEALEAAYESTEKSFYYIENDEHTLFIEEDENHNVWNRLFKKHHTRRSYDFALFWREGYL